MPNGCPILSHTRTPLCISLFNTQDIFNTQPLTACKHTQASETVAAKAAFVKQGYPTTPTTPTQHTRLAWHEPTWRLTRQTQPRTQCNHKQGLVLGLDQRHTQQSPLLQTTTTSDQTRKTVVCSAASCSPTRRGRQWPSRDGQKVVCRGRQQPHRPQL